MIRPTSLLAVGLICWLSSPALAVDISKDVNDLKYFYFPTSSNKVEIRYNDGNSLEASNLQAGRKTVVIVDGFLSDSTSPMSLLTKDTYIQRGEKNVVVIDWGRLSASGLTLGNPLATASAYISVLGNVGPVGTRLAEFLNFLHVNKQIEFSDITLLGHSLGAHIAGAAGRVVESQYGASLARIVGLDPAGSFLGMGVEASKRLKKGDASFVDIYNSNRGTLGDSTHDTGDINVYINGGAEQPGCEEADNGGFAGYCSHSYSWKLFNAANGNGIRGCPCSGNDCVCLTCEYECSNPIVVGPNVPSSTRGRIHVVHGELP